ncbi:hypothetical protein ABK040_010028 [Willaertia magna]
MENENNNKLCFFKPKFDIDIDDIDFWNKVLKHLEIVENGTTGPFKINLKNKLLDNSFSDIEIIVNAHYNNNKEEKTRNILIKIPETPEGFGNDLKYIVDSSLCGIGNHLRKLGVDIKFDKTYSDAFILHLAKLEDRIIITRSTKLMYRLVEKEKTIKNWKEKLKILENEELLNEMIKQRLIKPFQCKEEIEEEKEILKDNIEQNIIPYKLYWVTSVGSKEQLREIVDKFKIIFVKDKMFTRCFHCNGIIVEVTKEDVKDILFKKTLENNERFTQCLECKQVFWGSEDGNAYQRKFFKNSIEFCEEYSYHPLEL